MCPPKAKGGILVIENMALFWDIDNRNDDGINPLHTFNITKAIIKVSIFSKVASILNNICDLLFQSLQYTMSLERPKLRVRWLVL